MHINKASENESTADTYERVLRALLPNQQALEDAMRQLQESEFHTRDLAALVPWPEPGTEFSHRAGTKAPEGAMIGATLGAALGAFMGWLSSTGHLPIPGVELLRTYNPLLIVSAGLGALGVCGALIGALLGVRVPEYETMLSEGVIPKGGLLVAVNCRNSYEQKRATEILEQFGARAIASSSVRYRSNDRRFSSGIIQLWRLLRSTPRSDKYQARQ
jgi:hypothetical protein